MITVHPYRKHGGSVSFAHKDTNRLHDLATRLHSQDAVEYILGMHKPNYPMPAIRLVTQIDSEFVSIWRYGVGCDFYCDDYETVFNY